MGVFASLPASANGPVAAVQELLKRLLAEGQAKAVLVMMETRDGLGVQPALVTRGERLETANPFLPVMPVHLARMASLLTERGVGEGQRPERVAVVLRPCELRALVELAKLKQADLGQLLTIGVDCVGTCEGADWKRWASSEPQALALYLDAAQRGSLDSPGPAYRHACRICQTPSSWNPDLGIHWLGLQGAVMVEAEKPDLLESLRLTSDADPTAHLQVVEQVLHTRLEARQARLDEVAAQMQPTGSGQPGLVVAFEACQRCHNCTVACPICYCKECLFRTDNMRHEARHYLTGSERKGVVRLPGDTVAFQLTRLTHVSMSCVGCGMCTSACPADLPVDALFQAVARRTQALFDYVPGRSLEDPLPPATYERTEFVGLGEVER
jgi:formate dehydrogenase (coenzyme F420) beta subunit